MVAFRGCATLHWNAPEGMPLKCQLIVLMAHGIWCAVLQPSIMEFMPSVQGIIKGAIPFLGVSGGGVMKGEPAIFYKYFTKVIPVDAKDGMECVHGCLSGV
jgi:hypothetical protein